MDTFQLDLPKRTHYDRFEDLLTKDELDLLVDAAKAGGVTPGTLIAMVIEEFLLSIERRIVERRIIDKLSVDDIRVI